MSVQFSNFVCFKRTVYALTLTVTTLSDVHHCVCVCRPIWRWRWRSRCGGRRRRRRGRECGRRHVVRTRTVRTSLHRRQLRSAHLEDLLLLLLRCIRVHDPAASIFKRLPSCLYGSKLCTGAKSVVYDRFVERQSTCIHLSANWRNSQKTVLVNY